VATHQAIQKYVHIYTSILSTYATYITFKWKSMMGGPQSQSGCCEREKKSYHYWELNPDSSAIQPVNIKIKRIRHNYIITGMKLLL
jgi:hypothetical protein